MNYYTHTLLTFILACFFVNGTSQVVTTNPSAPTDKDALTITFHADLGNAGLVNYSGDIYAHTGVITKSSSSSSDWKYVKAGWTENRNDCKLTKTGDNTYTLELTPSIREFYNVPEGEIIEQIALVFRNEDSSQEGKDDGNKDVFIDVFQDGLNVSFTSPTTRWEITNTTTPIDFVGGATESANLTFTIEDTLVLASATGTEISSVYTFQQFGNYTVYLHADNGTDTAIDSVEIIVLKPATTAETPSYLRDGIHYDSNKVSFVVYAPYKSSVILMGDFNNWTPSNAYQLNKWNSYWWITIEVEDPNQEYAFQYLIDGELTVVDPYVSKILDPWNDKYIPESVYPNLKEYPLNKANGIVGIINPGKKEYDWGTDEVTVPDNEDLIIYELLIRDFVESHDIKGVQDKLDYLQKLGVNAIELMPFNEFEGNSSWGYNPSFYFATDKYYGTETDYKNFIKECHSRGMVVFMDIVLNHAFGQNPMVQMYFNPDAGEYGQPTGLNPWFNQTSPNTAYSWGYDFDHESVHTQDFVDSVLSFWTKEFHIDGFRFDFTKGFTNKSGDGWAYDASRIALLKRMYDQLKEVNPESKLILEHLSDNAEEKILANYGFLMWGNMNHSYNEATMGYLGGSGLTWQSYIERGWSEPNLVAYMESHDEERTMFKNITYGNSSGSYDIQHVSTALNRNEMAAVFYFAVPGPKMIWQFGEYGYDISIDSNGRTGEKPIKWEMFKHYDNRDLFNIYAAMIDLKKDYPIFSTSDFILKTGDNIADKKIILRSDETDVFIVGNFDVEELTTTAEFTETGTWYDVFYKTPLEVTDVNMDITLNPGEYKVYASTPLEIVEGIPEREQADNKTILVYPNPANNVLTIQNKEQLAINKLVVFDTTGREVMVRKNITNSELLTKIDISALNGGLYFLYLVTGSENISVPFMKK